MTSHSVDQLLKLDRTALPPDGGESFNRLIFSSSPYLLQHATNPVDWFPWSDDAFERARNQDKPVLVSVGYSTCHWCHVMADESFADRQVAELLNRDFIAVKIDREERPDLDAVYMAVCQMMTGQGGWPLTLLVTPDRQPFFAATYLPKNSRGGMIGMLELLTKVSELWHNERHKLLKTCEQVVNALSQLQAHRADRQAPNQTLLRKASEQFKNVFDKRNGGFGDAPKFPTPHNLSLLTRLGQRFRDPELTGMASHTLQAIRRGGIYDQVGFGLHRYSVDAHWLVPHFEKMLYDQALYILACLDTWQVTKEELLAAAARQTASYVLRDLQHPPGGFYAGEDADSEGAEGTFYLWTEPQLRGLLTAEQAELACRLFQVAPHGNFEGRSILHLAPQTDLPADDDPLLQELRRQRATRPRPHRDEKILTGWNGLMIAALARLDSCLGRADALEAARRAYQLIEDNLVREDGRLLRRYFDAQAGVPAFFEDYAALSWGCLELYQAGFANEHLAAALHWTKQMLQLFDDGAGSFYDTAHDSEVVMTRHRSLQDGALPAGISMAAGVLLRLGRLTGHLELEQRGITLLEVHTGQYSQHPSAYAQALLAIDELLGPTAEVTIVRGENASEARNMLTRLRQEGRLRIQVLWKQGEDAQLDQLAPRQQRQAALDGDTTAYLCSGRRCLEPVKTVDELQTQINELVRGSQSL